eukprot:210426-Chlamydomonas_euryale.AAC.1
MRSSCITGWLAGWLAGWMDGCVDGWMCVCLAHQPGHMGLATLADASPKQKRRATGHASRRRRQTVVVERSELGESPVGVILMFGRVGVNIAAMTCARGCEAMGLWGYGATRVGAYTA